jgi:proteasome accessory factor A
MGLETEFCVRLSADSSPPSKLRVCRTILNALESIVRTAPGEREGEPNFQRFVQNGGAFTYEVSSPIAPDGLLESSTPECRSPLQLLLYQRAQESLIREALRIARPQLRTAGYAGDVAIVKNCRDAKGNVYGTQENYEAVIARGWRLAAYRTGLALLLPWVLLSAPLLFLLFVVLGIILGLVMLLFFPLARHWLGYSPYSSSSSEQEDEDEDEFDVPAPVQIVFGSLSLAVLLPPVLAFPLLLRATAFREIRRGATAFLASRVILTGAGTIHDDGTFGLSERAASVSSTMRLLVWGRRCFFDPANLCKPFVLCSNHLVGPLLALFSSRQRLQLGLSDSNCAQLAEYLKIGTTALVIDMAEAEFLDDAPRVRRPAAALKCISGDPTLRARVPLIGGGSISALELQRWYLNRAEQFLTGKRVASLETWEIVTLWRRTLDALQRDPSSLVGSIDWVTKRALLKGSEAMSFAARKKIDIKYHELGSGYFSLLERRGITSVRLNEADIADAMYRPPTQSPAWLRGQLITQWGQRQTKSVSWRTGSA